MADDAKPEDATAETAETAATDKKPEETTVAPKDDNGKPLIHVKVFAPFRVYFEGDAYSLTAINESGPFDVLPHHRNFLCMLVPCDLIIHTPQDVNRVKISRALMHVKAEKITVYLDV